MTQKIIGLTGGMGAGKSTVGKIFSCLGFPVFDADWAVKSIYNNDPSIIEPLIETFGEQVIDQNQKFNFNLIKNIIFTEPEKKIELEQIIHPRLDILFNIFCTEHQLIPIIIKEAALIFETNSYTKNHLNILVIAPIELRIARIAQRDPQRNHHEIIKMIESQWPDEAKIKLADVVIENGSNTALIPQITQLANMLG